MRKTTKASVAEHIRQQLNFFNDKFGILAREEEIDFLPKFYLKRLSKKKLKHHDNKIYVHPKGIKHECHFCSIKYYIDNYKNHNIEYYFGFGLWVNYSDEKEWIVHSYILDNDEKIIIELAKYEFEKYIGLKVSKEDLIFLNSVIADKSRQLGIHEHFYSRQEP